MSRPRKRGKRAAKASYEISGLAYVRQLEAAPLVYQGERVMTISMVAQAFNVSLREAQNALAYATRQRREDGELKFREGEHKATIVGSEVVALRASIQAGYGLLADSVSKHNSFGIGPKVTKLTLLTKRGVLKVAARFLGSDEADDVLEELIETYLTVKEDLQGKLVEAASVMAQAITAPLVARLELLEDLYREDRAARKLAASRAAKDLAARGKEKKREAQAANALQELLGEVKPGHSLEDSRAQIYLFPPLSMAQLAEFLALRGIGMVSMPGAVNGGAQ